MFSYLWQRFVKSNQGAQKTAELSEDGLSKQDQIIKEIVRIIPDGKSVDAYIVEKVRQALTEYAKKAVCKSEDIRTLSEIALETDLQECLRYFPTGDLSESFKLEITGKSIGRFIKGESNPFGKTLRTYALFLCLMDRYGVPMMRSEELLENSERLIAAECLHKYLYGDFEGDLGEFKEIEGTFISRNTSEQYRETIALMFQHRGNNQYLMVTEVRVYKKDKQLEEPSIKLAKGWAFLNGTGTITVILNRLHTSIKNHSYSELSTRSTDAPVFLTTELVLFRNHRAFSIKGSSKFDLQNKSVNENLKRRIFHFGRFSEGKLTNSLLFDDISEGDVDVDSVMRAIGKQRFVQTSDKVKGKGVMDDQEQKALNKEMLDAYIADEIEEFHECLRRGADLNYPHPRTGETIMHDLWATSPLGYIEQTIAMSHHEIDYLARDKMGRLMSEGCLEHNHPVVYWIVKDREQKAGLAKGIYPDKRENVPLTEQHFRPAEDFKTVNPEDAPKWDDPFYLDPSLRM